MKIAEVAQVDYLADQIRMDDLARELAATNAPLMAALYRRWAGIAYRAGKAEKHDPDPGVAPCGICQGVLRCDLDAHLDP